MCRRIWPFARSSPTPKPSTPALLLMVVRFLTPLWTRARIRFSGFPHKPNPPTMMVAPSNTSWIASSALATTLCMAGEFYKKSGHLIIGPSGEFKSSDDPMARSPDFLRLSALPWRTFSQLVRAFEFRCQFPRVQILANVRETLFQLLQRVAQVLAIGDGDVAPHRIGAAGDAGHLAEGSSADVEHGRVGAEFVDQRGGQGG